MAGDIKKSKDTAKPRKAATQKAPLLTMESNGARSSVTKPFPHDEVARLAHRYWAERGGQHGHDVEDWFRAEQELRGKAS
jgi:hypothetical protein